MLVRAAPLASGAILVRLPCRRLDLSHLEPAWRARARHDDEPPDRGPPRPGRLEVPPGHAGGPPGPPDQLLLQPPRRRPGRHGPAAGHLGGPQAAVDRLRGDRRRQDRVRAGRAGDAAPSDASRRWSRPSLSTAGPASSGDDAARRAADRPRRHRRHRRLQGHRGVPPPRRRRRPRRAGDDQGRRALRRRDDVLGAGLRARAHVAVGRRRSHPAHPPRPVGRPGGGGARPRPGARRLRRRHLRRPAHRHAARHPGAGGGLPGHAHRDVGAPRGAGEPGHPARAAASTWSSPRSGRLAGGDVGAGRLAAPERIVAAVERALGPARPRRASASSSPPAAPASRSTPCGHHQPLVGQAGLRPRRRGRRPGAREVTLVTTVDRPAPAGRRGGRRRDGRRDGGGRDAARPPPPTWS